MADYKEDVDLDFGDDLEFDDLSFETDVPEEDRSPIETVKENVLDGFVSKVSDTREAEQELKKVLPGSYRTTYEFTQDQLSELDRAKEAFLNPIRKEMPDFKRNLNRLTPMVKRMVGDNLGEKFDELTKEAAKSQVDYDRMEIAQTVGGIFGSWREQQEKDKVEGIAERLMGSKNDEERFKLSYEQLASIDASLRKQVAYQDQVAVEAQSKQLELSYKKYHLLRNLLKVSTEAFGAHLTELKAITKNTGLPDIIKEQNSELFFQTLQEQWYGKSVDRVTDYGQQYFRRFTDSIVERAKEAGANLADTMGQVGDFAAMYADQQEQMEELGMGQEKTSFGKTALGIGGNMFGSQLASGAMQKGAERLGKFLEENEKARRIAVELDYFNQNRIQSFESALGNLAERDGFLGTIGEYLQDLAPSIGEDRENIRNNLDKRLTDRAQFDGITRESVVAIIPGWLSKIHVAIKELSLGVGNVEQETYDIFSERFVTEREATVNAMSDLVKESERETANEITNELVDKLFEGQEELLASLGDEGRRLMQELFIKEARNRPELNVDAFGARNSYESLDSYNETVAQSVADAIREVMGTTESGLFQGANSGLTDTQLAKRSGLGRTFKGLASNIPEIQQRLNALDFSGGVDRLRQAGLLAADGGIDQRELDAFILGRGSMDQPKTPKQAAGPTSPFTPPSGMPGAPQAPSSSPEQIQRWVDQMAETMGRFDPGTGEVTIVGLDEKVFPQLSEALKRHAEDNPDRAMDFKPITDRLDSGNASLVEIRSLLAALVKSSLTSEEQQEILDKIKGFGGDVVDLLKKPWTFATDAIGGFYGGVWSAATGAFNGAKKFGGGLLRGLMGSPDIYIVGEAEPVLLGKNIARGIYYNQTADGLDSDPIRELGDIRGPVFDIESERVVVSQEEFDAGLETRTLSGMGKRIGGVAQSVMQMPMNMVNFATRTFFKGVGFMEKGIDAARKAVTDYLNQAMDLYDDQGNLLLTAKGFLRGDYYIMVDGKLKVIRNLKDLMEATGPIYRVNAEGEPEVVVDQETLQRGLRTITGKLVEAKGMMAGAVDLARRGAGVAKDIFMMPVNLAKRAGGWISDLMKNFGSSTDNPGMTETMFVHAKTVNVYAMGMGVGGGQGPNNSTDFASFIERANENLEKAMETAKDKAQTTAQAAEEKYRAMSEKVEDKLDEARLMSEKVSNEIADELREQRDDENSKFNRTVAFFKDQYGELSDKISEGIKEGMAKDKVRGDTDGDGTRDGSWQEKLAERNLFKRNKEDDDRPKKREKTNPEDGIMSKILAALSGVGGILMSMLGGVGSAAGGLLSTLGLTKAASILTGAAGGAAAKEGTKAATKAAVKTVAKKAATKVAARGAAMGAGALFGGVIAPVIVIAGALWTAYEVGDAVYGYFDRRSNLGKYEYGRFLQYGYFTGNEGGYEDLKVNLRYFESEMIDLIGKDKNGNGIISKSPGEIWEEYATDLGGDPGNVGERREFMQWFNTRFKPVLFKWLSVIAVYRLEMEKEKSGWFSSVSLSLDGLDEELPENLAEDFITRVMDYSVLSFDPLEQNYGASAEMPIMARRKDAQKYFDEFILGRETVAIKEDLRVKPTAAVTPLNAAKKQEAERKQPPKLSSTEKHSMVEREAQRRKAAVTAQAKPKPKPTKTNVADIRDERILKYEQIIASASSKYNVDPALVREVIKQESGGVPTAVSRVGAAGLMQLMPVTAREVSVTDRFDPVQNIHGGTQYLAKKIAEFDGSVPLGLAGYNAGAGNIRRAIRKAGSSDPEAVLATLPQVTGRHAKETQNYVAKISAGYEAATKQAVTPSNAADAATNPTVDRTAIARAEAEQATRDAERYFETDQGPASYTAQGKSRANAFLDDIEPMSIDKKPTPKANAPVDAQTAKVSQAVTAKPDRSELRPKPIVPEPLNAQEMASLVKLQSEQYKLARETLHTGKLQLAELVGIRSLLTQARAEPGRQSEVPKPEPKPRPDTRVQLAREETRAPERTVDITTQPIDSQRTIA